MRARLVAGPWALLAGVAALGLLARLPLAFVAPTAVDDTDDYFGAATTWLHGADAAGAMPVGSFRPPGYAVLLLPLEPLPGSWQYATSLAHLGLGVLLAVAVAWLAWRWFDRATAALAGVLAALAPVMIATERLLTPDAVFTALLLAGTALVVEAVRRAPPSLPLLAGAGALFGVTAYVKPVAQVLVLAGVFPLALATRDLRQTLRGSLVLGGVLMLVIAPWIARNALVYERPLMGTVGQTNLFLRVFDVDERPLPDTEEGRLVDRIRRQIESREDPPFYFTFNVDEALIERGYTEEGARSLEGKLALRAIGDYPLGYLRRTATGVGDLADYATSLNGPHLRPLDEELPRSELDGFRGLAYRLWKLAEVMADAWWLLCAHGLLALALLFSPRRDQRAAMAALVGTWLLVATATSLTAPPFDGLARFPAQGAPLLWIAGSAGLVFAASAVFRTLRAG